MIVADVKKMREIYAQIGLDVWYANGLLATGRRRTCPRWTRPPGPGWTYPRSTRAWKNTKLVKQSDS